MRPSVLQFTPPSSVALTTIGMATVTTAAFAAAAPGIDTTPDWGRPLSVSSPRVETSEGMTSRREPGISRSGSGLRSTDASVEQPVSSADNDAESASARRSAALLRLEEQAEDRRRELLRSAREERARRAWVAPVGDYTITATFGDGGAMWSASHTGLDLAAPSGTPVMAVGTAEVLSSGYDGPYGNKVELLHPDGTVTWYAHMTTIAVTAGQQVTAGEVIGTVGATGNVTGPHLHLEVRPGGGDPVDPLNELAMRGVNL